MLQRINRTHSKNFDPHVNCWISCRTVLSTAEPLAMGESSETLTWDQIQRFIKTGELHRLVRSPEIATNYRQFKAELEAKGKDLVSNMLECRLGWDVNELNRLNNELLPTDEDKINALFKDKSTLKILTNDFPYNFETSVTHILIWSKIYIPLYHVPKSPSASGGDSKSDDAAYLNAKDPRVVALIEQLLNQLLTPLGITEYVWFINYPRLQSIKTVSHIHVLAKCNDKLAVQKLVDGEALKALK